MRTYFVCETWIRASIFRYRQKQTLHKYFVVTNFFFSQKWAKIQIPLKIFPLFFIRGYFFFGQRYPNLWNIFFPDEFETVAIPTCYCYSYLLFIFNFIWHVSQCYLFHCIYSNFARKIYSHFAIAVGGFLLVVSFFFFMYGQWKTLRSSIDRSSNTNQINTRRQNQIPVVCW